MKVLFNETVGNKSKGTIAEVANGFAMNYLFPKNLAKLATKKVIKEYEDKQKSKIYHDALYEASAKETASKIDGQILETSIKIGKDGKVFGTVTSKDVSELIEKSFGISVDKKKISTEDSEIKSSGRYVFVVKFCPNVNATIYVDVTAVEAN